MTELPETIRTYMKVWEKVIKTVAKITDSPGKVYYEAGGKDYLFNAQGKPIREISG